MPHNRGGLGKIRRGMKFPAPLIGSLAGKLEVECSESILLHPLAQICRSLKGGADIGLRKEISPHRLSAVWDENFSPISGGRFLFTFRLNSADPHNKGGVGKSTQEGGSPPRNNPGLPAGLTCDLACAPSSIVASATIRHKAKLEKYLSNCRVLIPFLPFLGLARRALDSI